MTSLSRLESPPQACAPSSSLSAPRPRRGHRGEAEILAPGSTPDDLTAGEWLYLCGRYGEAEALDRRDRLVLTIKRLVRTKGRDPKRIHAALAVGIDVWRAHAQQQTTTKPAARQWNARVATARKDMARALASLRRLLPPEFPKELRSNDDRHP